MVKEGRVNRERGGTFLKPSIPPSKEVGGDEKGPRKQILYEDMCQDFQMDGGGLPLGKFD